MRPNLLNNVALSLLLLSLASGASAQPGTGRIVGKIIDQKTRQPLAAEVGASLPIQGKILFKHALATGRGEFILEGVEAGNVHLTTKLDGYAAEHLDISLKAGETRTVEFSLSKARFLRGVIRNSGGRPLSGAMVRVIYQADIPAPGESRTTYQWEAGDTYSNDRGAFEIPVHPEKDFVIEASHPGFLTAVSTPRRAPAGKEAAVSLTLETGVSFTGAVRDEHGNPVPGAQVRLVETAVRRDLEGFTSHELLRQQHRLALSAPDGTFRLDSLAPTRKTLVVVHPGFRPLRHTLDLEPGKSASAMTLVLESRK